MYTCGSEKTMKSSVPFIESLNPMNKSFTVQQSALLSLLASMQPICTKRTALDVTESILFQVSPRELILKSTDLEISLQSSVQIESSLTESFKFLVSGKRIFDLVKELDGEIEFVFEEKNIRINASSSIGLSLAVKESDDFPPFPECIENLMHMEASFLLSMLGKVGFLVSSNNANPALNGMLLDCNAEQVSMVATDGHSLVRVATSLYKLHEEKKWLLPKRAVLELKKILEVQSVEQVFLGTCNGQLVFSGPTFNFFTRLIAEPFPHYEPVLEKEGFIGATLDRDAFSKTLKRAGCLLAGQFISTAFTFKPGSLGVRLDNKEVGTLHEALMLGTFEGKEVASRFYSPYLLSGLQIFNEKEVSLFIKNDARPIIFESIQENLKVTYVVMPISAQQNPT